MKHISILLPSGVYSVVNVMGSFQMLNAANDLNIQRNGKALFEIDLVGEKGVNANLPAQVTVNPTKEAKEISKTDIIIIPAVHEEPSEAIRLNEHLAYFIETQYKQGATLVSLCIGAYILAATGLLDGKPCSTHWQHSKELKSMFPKVIVKEERVITESSEIITSGGAYAFTNLIVYLIEKFGGRRLAIDIAKLFMIDIDRISQTPYAMFNGEKMHKDDLVLGVQEYLENNFTNKFTIDQLALDFHIVRRTLERRFKKATGNSINVYLQRLRIEAAKGNLEQGRMSVNEVMYDSGYNDSKAFRDVFKKYAGISPLEYRQKYSMRVSA